MNSFFPAVGLCDECKLPLHILFYSDFVFSLLRVLRIILSSLFVLHTDEPVEAELFKAKILKGHAKPFTNLLLHNTTNLYSYYRQTSSLASTCHMEPIIPKTKSHLGKMDEMASSRTRLVNFCTSFDG